jgi:hypothetical protein
MDLSNYNRNKLQTKSKFKGKRKEICASFFILTLMLKHEPATGY